MKFYKNKNVLVAGGTGMIGKPLVDILLEDGANVRISSLDDSSRANPEAEFIKADLRDYESCKNVCKDRDYVFNLLGIKGSPKMTKEKPLSFLEPVILFNTNLMRAARDCNVERFLFTSTIGVYSPAEVFREDDVFKTLPSENDLYAAYAKRVGELQAAAYKEQCGWDKISIVRPANVYGPFDNFDPANAMVIPSLIKRAIDGENPLMVWGDGSPIRDFIYAKDVAEGMALDLEKGYNLPINLGSGKERTIKEVVEIIKSNMKNPPQIVWDSSKPSGDKKRLMDISRAENLGWFPKVSLEEGIKKTIEWYTANKNQINKRYNIFNK